MGLKQIKDPDRIIFLKEFTKQILLDISEEEKSKENIEIEKLRRKFVEPYETKKISENIIKSEPMMLSIVHRQQNPELEKRKQIFHRERIIIKPQMQIRPVFKPKPQINPQHFETLQMKTPLKIIEKPAEFPRPETTFKPAETVSGNPFQKINPLLRDATILSIECPGPGKHILIRKYNQVNTTRMTLSQPEINAIINDYSMKSRIPVIGGIIKAAVGNTIISGIISEFVGSRFIINKITPYSILQRGI